ncbi:MAG: peptidylprolyl isomerase [Gammaproteobacteria bacterium]|jgi:FKBP-type peptidyl-prolyl cis-trans isomerase SlyD
MSSQTVTKGKMVSMQYSLTTADGVVVRTAEEEPIRYIHGEGMLFPRLEAALEGNGPGDVVRVKLLPDDAFGKRDVDLVHEIPLGELPAGEHIEIGGQLVGKDEAGRDVPFRITEIRDDIVYLDGNNPLAGHTLIFEVELQDIRDATEAELEAARQSG